MEIDEIKEKADWCLGCKSKPCSNACPMNTNIPEFIEEIKKENIKQAYDILIENNIFSHICSQICPQENQCEGSCVRGVKQTATKIGDLEKFVNVWAKENNIKPDISTKLLKKDVKVAIVGGGPAGLACSYELIKNGIKSVVYEKENVLGGILAYGIPDFRLNKSAIDDIVNTLKSLGVEFKLGYALGENIKLNELKNEYDFVFLGIGAELSSVYKLSEEDLNSVYDSDTFLRAYNNKKYIDNLGKVVVIGGGNVAMDAARAAIHMGAEKVSILYRRDEEHMPARKIELKEAIQDGVEFKELVRVISAENVNGKIENVHCIKTKIVDGKAVDCEGEEFDYEANTVIFAIGLKPNKKLLENEGIKLTDWGTIEVDENNQTSVEKVYAGGDVVDNKSVVCKALASGKKAATSIINETERMKYIYND